MSAITRLPGRPLRGQDIAALDNDDQLQVVPYGGIPEGEDVQIYALKIAVGETAHALGFDDARNQWEQLATVDASDLAAADSQLEAVLDDWVQDNYAGRFEVLKTV
jgi:hypothetical protein